MAAAKAAKAAAAATATHAHTASSAVGGHTTAATRSAKLAIVARSVRGINRNLRLQGYPGVAVRVVKGKGLQAFKGAAKVGKVIMHNGAAATQVKMLTYGQWVNAIATTLKLKASK